MTGFEKQVKPFCESLALGLLPLREKVAALDLIEG